MAGQGKYMKLPVRVIILTFPLKVENKSRKISDRVFHIVKKKPRIDETTYCDFIYSEWC